MFVPLQGQTGNFAGHTLVIPCTAVGLSPHIAMDLYFLNEGAVKIGYFDSLEIKPACSNDILTLQGEQPGKISMPAEFWQAGKMTFLAVRTGVVNLHNFCKEVVTFAQEKGFSNVVILTATISPVQRDRNSNRLIPNIYAYQNNYFFKSRSNYC